MSVGPYHIDEKTVEQMKKENVSQGNAIEMRRRRIPVFTYRHKERFCIEDRPIRLHPGYDVIVSIGEGSKHWVSQKEYIEYKDIAPRGFLGRLKKKEKINLEVYEINSNPTRIPFFQHEFRMANGERLVADVFIRYYVFRPSDDEKANNTIRQYILQWSEQDPILGSENGSLVSKSISNSYLANNVSEHLLNNLERCIGDFINPRNPKDRGITQEMFEQFLEDIKSNVFVTDELFFADEIEMYFDTDSTELLANKMDHAFEIKNEELGYQAKLGKAQSTVQYAQEIRKLFQEFEISQLSDEQKHQYELEKQRLENSNDLATLRIKFQTDMHNNMKKLR